MQGLPEVLDSIAVEVSHPDFFSVHRPRSIVSDVSVSCLLKIWFSFKAKAFHHYSQGQWRSKRLFNLRCLPYKCEICLLEEFRGLCQRLFRRDNGQEDLFFCKSTDSGDLRITKYTLMSLFYQHFIQFQITIDDRCIDTSESTSLILAHYEKIVFTLIVIFVTWIFVARSNSLKSAAAGVLVLFLDISKVIKSYN